MLFSTSFRWAVPPDARLPFRYSGIPNAEAGGENGEHLVCTFHVVFPLASAQMVASLLIVKTSRENIPVSDNILKARDLFGIFHKEIPCVPRAEAYNNRTPRRGRAVFVNGYVVYFKLLCFFVL